MEEYAYVLDCMPQSSIAPKGPKKETICYAVGEQEFKLFELVPKDGAVLSTGDRIYIGKDQKLRTEIDHVKRRIEHKDLSNFASSELEHVVLEIVMANQDRFIRFYNEAQALTLKKHMLEELPGLGKKMMQAILEERSKEKFKDFADLDARVPILKGGAKLIVERIILEISDSERRRYLFVSK
jgi:putative nucleotide binding protein